MPNRSLANVSIRKPKSLVSHEACSNSTKPYWTLKNTCREASLTIPQTFLLLKNVTHHPTFAIIQFFFATFPCWKSSLHSHFPLHKGRHMHWKMAECSESTGLGRFWVKEQHFQQPTNQQTSKQNILKICSRYNFLQFQCLDSESM